MNTNKTIRLKSERGERMGIFSQEKTANERLIHALNHEPIRPITRCLMFTVETTNHITGIKHTIEYSHDPGNGNNRCNVYLDGDKWRNGWSRWRFVNWLFGQIDPVIADWE